MKPSISAKAAAIAGIVLGGLGLMQAAQARTDVVFTVGVQAPAYYAPQPYVVAPAPVYVAPRPVYVAPQPVYAQPAPVYYRPARDEWRREEWQREHWQRAHWRRWHQMHHRGWEGRDCDD
jgi:arylamine N-acetyltransferase